MSNIWRLLTVHGRSIKEKPRAEKIDGAGLRCAARLMTSEARANSKKLGRAMHDQCYMHPTYRIDDNVYCTRHASMITLRIMSGEIDHG